MHELVKKWEKFEKTEVDENEAIKLFKDNQYKEELINGIVVKKKRLRFISQENSRIYVEVAMSKTRKTS